MLLSAPAVLHLQALLGAAALQAEACCLEGRRAEGALGIIGGGDPLLGNAGPAGVELAIAVLVVDGRDSVGSGAKAPES
jgi:hypothetical protein